MNDWRWAGFACSCSKRFQSQQKFFFFLMRQNESIGSRQKSRKMGKKEIEKILSDLSISISTHFQKIPKSFDIPPPKVSKTFFTGTFTFFDGVLWEGLEREREWEREGDRVCVHEYACMCVCVCVCMGVWLCICDGRSKKEAKSAKIVRTKEWKILCSTFLWQSGKNRIEHFFLLATLPDTRTHTLALKHPLSHSLSLCLKLPVSFPYCFSILSSFSCPAL